jgi:hypothetical protein
MDSLLILPKFNLRKYDNLFSNFSLTLLAYFSKVSLENNLSC